MLFNSFEFMIFLPFVVLVFFLLPPRHRWVFMLAASYVFYASYKVEYLILMLVTTVTIWYSGLRINSASTDRAKKAWLAFSLVFNFGILFVYKYADFASDSVQQFFTWLGAPLNTPTLGFLLPVGISFYTFHSVTYTIDLYRGKMSLEPNLGRFALFVSFFPQLVAGPIERADHLLPQLNRLDEVRVDYNRFTEAFKWILWGLFKKIVIADRIAIAVNQVYSAPDNYHGLTVVIATYLFAVQIYCDFSGYSDMAIGVAKLFGVDLLDNFRRPYFSKSIPEFWRRWHMSLSTWFRDYLYIPLGGNRVQGFRYAFNMAAVFLVSGLWHGASWTFFIWGALHATYMLVGHYTTAFRARVVDRLGLERYPAAYRWFRTFVTFNLVSFAWIFFRAASVQDAFTLIRNLVPEGSPSSVALSEPEVTMGLLGTVALFLYELWDERRSTASSLNPVVNATRARGNWYRWLTYSGLLWVVVLFGKFGAQEFIYFAF